MAIILERADPDMVHFTHDSISNAFRSGLVLDDAIDRISEGRMKFTDFPSITCTVVHGRLHSLNNRRLFVVRVLRWRKIIDHISLRVLPFSHRDVQHLRDGASKWDRSFPTKNSGRTVHVSSRYEADQVAQVAPPELTFREWLHEHYKQLGGTCPDLRAKWLGGQKPIHERLSFQSLDTSDRASAETAALSAVLVRRLKLRVAADRTPLAAVAKLLTLGEVKRTKVSHYRGELRTIFDELSRLKGTRRILLFSCAVALDMIDETNEHVLDLLQSSDLELRGRSMEYVVEMGETGARYADLVADNLDHPMVQRTAARTLMCFRMKLSEETTSRLVAWRAIDSWKLLVKVLLKKWWSAQRDMHRQLKAARVKSS
eukprot:s1092_g6.t1